MEIKRDYVGMFDVLKGILLLLIVLVHHYSFINGGMRPLVTDAPGARLFGWSGLSMGLFFVIAGYQYRPAGNGKEYAKRQFRQLIVPYFTAVALAAVLRLLEYYLATGKIRIQEMSTLIAGGLYGAIQNMEIGGIWAYSIQAFWFLPTFFFSSLFFQWIQKIQNRKAAVICIWSLTAIAIYLPDAWHFQFPWFLVQSCAVLGFMEVGRLLKSRRILYGKLPLGFITCALFLYVGCHLFSEANIASNIWKAGVLDYAAACGMAVVVLRAYLKTGIGEKRYLDVFGYIGMYSMLFFLVHGMGLLVVPWEAPLGEKIMQNRIFYGRPLWFAGSCIYLARVLGILLGCYGMGRILKLHYKLRRKGEERGR